MCASVKVISPIILGLIWRTTTICGGRRSEKIESVGGEGEEAVKIDAGKREEGAKLR